VQSRTVATWLAEAGIILLAFGYYISAPIAILLNVDSRPINAAYRGIIVLLFSFPFILIPLIKTKFSIPEILLSTFFFIYSCRLFYDLEYRGILYNPYNTQVTKSFVYLFYYFNVLLPFIVIFRFRTDLNYPRIVRNMTWLLVVAIFLVVISLLTSDQFANRANIARFSLGADGSSTLNPIRISFIGFVATITGLFQLLFVKLSFIKKVLFGLVVGSGVFCLVIGASRGPLSLFLIALSILLFVWYRSRSNFKSKLVFWAAFGSVIIFSTNYISKHSEEIELFKRVNETVDRLESNEKEERNNQFEAAWSQFLESPILGDQWVIRSNDTDIDRVIPHNIVLESLMAVGILGSVFLFFTLCIFLWKFFNINSYLDTDKYILILVFCVLIQSFISGSLFMDVEMWCLFSLALNTRAIAV
jgi:O-antigen ligase